MRVPFREPDTVYPKLIRLSRGHGPLIIRGATIIDPSGTRPNHDILIESMRIVAVNPKIESDARTLNLSGAMVVPGLVHTWFDPGRPTIFGQAQRLKEILLQGVTTVHLPDVSLERGQALRQAILEELVPGPRLLLSASINDISDADLLSELRRFLGFGADLILLDDAKRPRRAIATQIASDLKKGVSTQEALQAVAWDQGESPGILFAGASSFSELEAISSSNLGAAIALGLGDSIGSVASGKVADLLLLNEGSRWPTAVLATG